MGKLTDRFQIFIFDLDGVLVDSYYAWFHLINEGLQKCGRPPIDETRFAETWGQGIEADQTTFFPEWSLDEIVSFYNESFSKHCAYVRVEEGSHHMMKTLREREKRIGVASNSPAEIVRILLDVAGVSNFVQATAGADEVASSKPAPDLIFHVLKKLNGVQQEACYIGDSNYDQEAARAANLFFIGYKRAGDLTIQTLTELLSASI